jgi:hypothetical protein
MASSPLECRHSLNKVAAPGVENAHGCIPVLDPQIEEDQEEHTEEKSV